MCCQRTSLLLDGAWGKRGRYALLLLLLSVWHNIYRICHLGSGHCLAMGVRHILSYDTTRHVRNSHEEGVPPGRGAGCDGGALRSSRDAVDEVSASPRLCKKLCLRRLSASTRETSALYAAFHLECPLILYPGSERLEALLL